jgi:hypothetical protein
MGPVCWTSSMLTVCKLVVLVASGKEWRCCDESVTQPDTEVEGWVSVH